MVKLMMSFMTVLSATIRYRETFWPYIIMIVLLSLYV